MLEGLVGFVLGCLFWEVLSGRICLQDSWRYYFDRNSDRAYYQVKGVDSKVDDINSKLDNIETLMTDIWVDYQDDSENWDDWEGPTGFSRN